MEILEDYMEKFAEIQDYNARENYEMAHIGEDMILRKFIRNIASGNLKKLKDIKLVATAIQKYMIEANRGQIRWYA